MLRGASIFSTELITSREFLQSRRIGLVTVAQEATDFVGWEDLHQDKCSYSGGVSRGNRIFL
jgi:hypothetical protein